jgi:hypothetical protein
MAINNDSIYRSADGKLEVVNMAGEAGACAFFSILFLHRDSRGHIGDIFR